MEARERLEGEGIATRVVSMPSWRLFLDQEAAYRQSVLPPQVPVRVSVEAGEGFLTSGHAYFHIPMILRIPGRDEGRVVGLDRFGASAPWQTLFREYELTVDRVVEEARGALRARPG